jgi:hypothetical protein
MILLSAKLGKYRIASSCISDEFLSILEVRNELFKLNTTTSFKYYTSPFRISSK